MCHTAWIAKNLEYLMDHIGFGDRHSIGWHNWQQEFEAAWSTSQGLLICIAMAKYGLIS